MSRAVNLLVLLLASARISLATDGPTILREKEVELHKTIAGMPPVRPSGYGAQLDAQEREKSVLGDIVAKTDDKMNDSIIEYLRAHQDNLTAFETSYLESYTQKLIRAANAGKLRYLFENFDGLLESGRDRDCQLAEGMPDGILIYFDMVWLDLNMDRPALVEPLRMELSLDSKQGGSDDASLDKARRIRSERIALLRMDFPAISRQEQSDDEFLLKAREWYMANRARLRVNHAYILARNLQQGPGPPGPDMSLFIPKS
jgi:hypothetical protein